MCRCSYATQDRTIVATFNFNGEDQWGDTIITRIYEQYSRLSELLLEGHTTRIDDLVLSFDPALLVSAACDNIFNLWMFKPLLASFHV